MSDLIKTESEKFDMHVQDGKKDLESMLDAQIDRYNIDPLSLDSRAWGNTYWDFMEHEERDRILAGMFRIALMRAMKVIPLYKNISADASEFVSMSQLTELHLLVKDGLHGFRQRVLDNPLLLRPSDEESLVAYFSGGTKGQSTPTFIHEQDLLNEAQALAFRCFMPGALHLGQNFYNFYNPTHKGGRMIEDAMKLLGARTIMTRRPEDALEVCIEKVKSYKVDSIAAVQPPLLKEEDVKKGSGVTFLKLYGADARMFGRDAEALVKYAFITGYMIPDEIINLSKDIGLHLFTTWGASEALPGSTSTVLGPETRICKYNNQHLLYGPHFLSLVKFTENGMRPVEVGEDGILLITTIARRGTIYINYAIGDKATLLSKDCPCGRTTPVITNIHRADPKEIEGGGCRYC